MKYAIFSDIHGNLEAYNSVLDAFKKEGKLKYFCIGDIVGYGANPRACIDITRTLNPVAVCGNHDSGSVGLASLDRFNDYAKKAVLWTTSMLDSSDKDYLKSLQLTYTDGDITLVHGTLIKPELFDYVFDFATAHRMMKLMKTDMAFIGHSHVPGVFILEGERIEYTTEPKIRISDQKSYLVNVGSIGQPRDGDQRAAFCVWDKDAGTIEIKRVVYDVAGAQKKIMDAGLPSFLAHRLGEGR